MSVEYRAIIWNRKKVVYDAIVLGAILMYLVLFVGVSLALWPSVDPVVALLRAAGTGALLLLHGILIIGPLSRMVPRVLPVLYNRRHLGVATFCLAALHVVLVLFWYGLGGVENPLTALLTSGKSFESVQAFPAELLGFVAFVILFVMAATSHDFWLANLGAGVWKAIHMLVYAAYGLLLVHAALMTHDTAWGLPVLVALAVGLKIVGVLHVLAGLFEAARDRTGTTAPLDEDELGRPPWVRVCAVGDVPESRGKVVSLEGADGSPRERVAIFRHNGALSAMSNVCAHQGGPLGEGRVVDGCVTCPWHGYQYLPHNGQSPPPYTEKIPTYALKIEGEDVYLDPRPLAPGTETEPAVCPAGAGDAELFEEAREGRPGGARSGASDAEERQP